MSYVDVFDVGEMQLRELIRGRLQDNICCDDAKYHTNYVGRYVIAHAAFKFGEMFWLSLIDVYDTCEQACLACESYNQAAIDRCLSGDKLADEFEVWAVVDDDDLWLAWESEVAYTRLGGVPCRYKVMDGSQCVACVDHVPTNVYVIAGMLGGDNCTYDHYVKADDFGEALAMCEINGAYIVRCGVSYVGNADCSITVRDLYTDEDVDADVTVLTVWVWAAGESC